MNALSPEMAGVEKAVVNRLTTMAEEGAVLLGKRQDSAAELLFLAAIEAAMKHKTYAPLADQINEIWPSLSGLADVEADDDVPE